MVAGLLNPVIEIEFLFTPEKGRGKEEDFWILSEHEINYRVYVTMKNRVLFLRRIRRRTPSSLDADLTDFTRL